MMKLENSQVDQAELRRRLERSFAAFDSMLTRAAQHNVEAAGVVGVWSVKDVVAHLIAHEQRTLEELRLAKQGQHLAIKHEENDSFNDGAVYACRAMPFEVVRDQWRRSYQQVVEAVQALNDADFDPEGEVVQALDDTIDGAVANNTYAHYDFHGAQIETWLKQQAKS